MKNYLLSCAISFLVAFLFFAFTQAEIDPFKWEQHTRSVMLFFGALFSIISSVAMFTKEDMKS